MDMRDYIDAVRVFCEAKLPNGWDLGGAWITNDGAVIEVDHANELHHADIALDHYGDWIDTDDDGNYDDYSRDAAQELAQNDGWIRISTKGTRTFSVEWTMKPSRRATQSLLSYLHHNTTPYTIYELAYPSNDGGGFDTFDEQRRFVGRIRQLLRST